VTAAVNGWDPTGLAILWLVAPLILLHGVIVVRDWRGLGARYCKLTSRFGGYNEFRFVVGWSTVAFALLLVVVGIVGLVDVA
jgi:hypothetical protein